MVLKWLKMDFTVFNDGWGTSNPPLQGWKPCVLTFRLIRHCAPYKLPLRLLRNKLHRIIIYFQRTIRNQPTTAITVKSYLLRMKFFRNPACRNLGFPLGRKCCGYGFAPYIAATHYLLSCPDMAFAIRSLTLAFTYSATQHRPFYAYEDCIERICLMWITAIQTQILMSLLTNDRLPLKTCRACASHPLALLLPYRFTYAQYNHNYFWANRKEVFIAHLWANPRKPCGGS